VALGVLHHHDAVVCQQAGLPLPTRSIGQMGGKEFEQLLLALRAPRA